VLTERYSAQEVIHARRKAAGIAFGILSVFAISGLSIFKVFSITLPAFQIAGGILILLLGIQQLNGNRTRVKNEEKEEGIGREDVSVFPIATPLLAGPGAISTVVLYASQAKTWVRLGGLVTSIALAMLASFFVLKLAHPLLKLLGKTGLNLLTRVMGIILTAVAVQFILNGIRGALASMGVLPPL
jgi:multiple antibiotic resistance protein